MLVPTSGPASAVRCSTQCPTSRADLVIQGDDLPFSESNVLMQVISRRSITLCAQFALLLPALSGCTGGSSAGAGAALPVTITMFSPITVEATGNESASVTPAAPQASGGTGAIIVTCDYGTPGSSIVATLGTTTLTCTATDTTGNQARGSSTVTVVDTHPPTLTMFAPIVVEATSPAGALVTVPVPVATDTASTPIVTCTPLIGVGQYALGVTTVACRATDGGHNVTTGQSTVSVVDTTPPTLSIFAPITVLATNSSGASVSIPTPVATDAASTPVVDCGAIPLGTPVPFLIGTTTVVCKATDASHNVTQASSSVTVLPSGTVSGTVSGLAGTVVLRDNGTDSLAVSAAGPFSFATPLALGASYNVTVAVQPTGQTCTVANGSGVLTATPVNVQVSCAGSVGPVLSMTPGIKQLNFSWTSVAGATSYKLMQNPDGASGFTQVGADLTTTSLALDITVYRQNWARALYLVEACNSSGCVSSNQVNTLNTMLQSIGYLKSSNTRNSQVFGYSLALSADGNTVAIGASGESSNATGINGDQTDTSQSSAGAVYVYTRTAGVWSAAPTYVKASNTFGSQFFGYALALSADGNTLAVGAFGERSNATGVGGNQTNAALSNAGAAYIYTRSAGVWSASPTYIKASNTKSEQHFGFALSLSGDGATLAVGAFGEASKATGVGGDQTDVSMNGAGAVYVYTFAAGVWSPTPTYLKASNTQAFQDFGVSLALSNDGNVLAIGAWGERSKSTGVGGDQTDVSMAEAGAVYVYARSAGVWSASPTYIKASNTAIQLLFGYALALSGDGNTLAVGGPGDASNATGINGSATDKSAPLAGAAYLYTRSAGVWSSVIVYVKPSNTQSNGVFGQGVALSSDGLTLAVGGSGEASNAVGIDGNQADTSVPGSGAVYVYSFSSGAWSATPTYVKASNTKSSQGFGGTIFNLNNGTPVALSGDGGTLVVGAAAEKSSATGIDGNQADVSLTNAGAVYLY
jgi:hypothetical protein